MKIFFLVSDTVVITAGGIVTLILSTLIIPLLYKIFNKQIEIREGQIKSHTQMDGMKDELMLATKLLGEAIGKAQGRHELRQELEEKTETAPAEVIIKKNLDK